MNSSQAAVDTAILFAGWHDKSEGATEMVTPAGLLPLMDRPLIQRVVEQLVRSGCKNLHVILGEHPALVREMLQTGNRWGCSITYHYNTEAVTLNVLMSRLSLDEHSSYLIADGNILPSAMEIDVNRLQAKHDSGVTYFWGTERTIEWSGWAILKGSWLLSKRIPCEREMVELAILRDDTIERIYSRNPIVVIKPTDLIKAGKQLLQTGQTYDSSYSIENNNSGIRIGRNCSIHSSSKLTPPIYLSEGVRVSEDAELGPNVVIGQGVFIDKDARLTECTVLPNTYVGEGIELNRVVACGSLLANAQLETVIEVTDRNILSYLPKHRTHRQSDQSFDKLVAMCLKILLYPAYFLFSILFKKSIEKRFLVADLPKKGSDQLCETTLSVAPPSTFDGTPGEVISHFIDTFYPGLGEIIRGNLKLCGPRIRSRLNVMGLHKGWMDIYWYSKSGLLQESLLMPNEYKNQQAQYASDALAANSKDPKATLKLVRKYLASVFVDLIKVAVGNISKRARMHRVTPLPKDKINHIHDHF